MLFLIISSWISVTAGVEIAKILGIDVAIIGGTIIAVGTSLPELALEIHAIRQKEYSLALGDIFGSSLINVSIFLGLLISINPGLKLNFGLKTLPFLTVALAITLFRMFRKKPLKIFDGVILIALSILYLVGVWMYDFNLSP